MGPHAAVRQQQFGASRDRWKETRLAPPPNFQAVRSLRCASKLAKTCIVFPPSSFPLNLGGRHPRLGIGCDGFLHGQAHLQARSDSAIWPPDSCGRHVGRKSRRSDDAGGARRCAERRVRQASTYAWQSRQGLLRERQVHAGGRRRLSPRRRNFPTPCRCSAASPWVAATPKRRTTPRADAVLRLDSISATGPRATSCCRCRSSSQDTRTGG